MVERGLSMTVGVQLAEVAVGQRGVFTRAQAIAAGFSAHQIERRVRAAEWARVLPRVYRNAATPMSRDLSRWAAVLWAGPECALSHASAAAIWRMPGAPPDRPEIVVANTRAPQAAGVVVHRVARLDDRDLRRVGGLPVTSPVRTIIDLASLLSERDLAAVVESARSRQLVTVRAVERRLDEIGAVGRPGAGRLRAILASFGSGQGGASVRMAG